MVEGHLERFVVLFFAGVGLLLTGVVNIALRRAGGLRRGLVTSVVCGLTLLVCWLCSASASIVATSSQVLAVGVVPCLLLGTRRVGTVLTATIDHIRRPAVHWSLAGVAGLAIILGSAVQFQKQDQAVVDAGMLEFDMLAAPPREPATTPAKTDRGSPVQLHMATAPRSPAQLRGIEENYFRTKPTRDHVIHRQPADDQTNCHGWVFAGGGYWLTGSEVEVILRDNDYQPIPRPRSGDLVVYRENGNLTHTAIVRYAPEMIATEQGTHLPILVEGKWGFSGVYLHPVEQSPYGVDITYYRSPRAGHLLAGLGGHPAALPVGPERPAPTDAVFQAPPAEEPALPPADGETR